MVEGSASVPAGAPLPPGSPAPDFALPSVAGDRMGLLRLSDLRGQPVILAFYPADWSPVCSDQMALYQAVLPEFIRYNAVLLGISVDGPWCHRAFAVDRGLAFPLLSDFEPKGAVSRAYGAYGPIGAAERALFVLDGDGTVAWSRFSAPEVNPGVDGVLDALDRLQQPVR